MLHAPTPNAHMERFDIIEQLKSNIPRTPATMSAVEPPERFRRGGLQTGDRYGRAQQAGVPCSAVMRLKQLSLSGRRRRRDRKALVRLGGFRSRCRRPWRRLRSRRRGWRFRRRLISHIVFNLSSYPAVAALEIPFPRAQVDPTAEAELCRAHHGAPVEGAALVDVVAAAVVALAPAFVSPFVSAILPRLTRAKIEIKSTPARKNPPAKGFKTTVALSQSPPGRSS
jgi:hypothetical protein